MQSISSSLIDTKLLFTPNTNTSSYFYTNLPPCVQASTENYDAIEFSIKGPVTGFQFVLEIQTSENCTVSAYSSHFFLVSTDWRAGPTQVIRVPLSKYVGANMDAVKAFVWSDFSATGGYEMGPIYLRCVGGIIGSSIASSSLV
jgi:hypothetical protein